MNIVVTISFSSMCLALVLTLFLRILLSFFTNLFIRYDTVGTMKRLFQSEHTGHAVLNLTTGFLILIGMINMWMYTSLGLAALPAVGCIKLGWTGVRDNCRPTSEDEEREKERENLHLHATKKERERKLAYDEIHRQRERTTKERKQLYVGYIFLFFIFFFFSSFLLLFQQ